MEYNTLPDLFGEVFFESKSKKIILKYLNKELLSFITMSNPLKMYRRHSFLIDTREGYRVW